MNGEDVLRCVACDSDLTVKDVLIGCEDLAQVKQRYYDAENLIQLFQDIIYLISCMRWDCFMEYCLFMFTWE